MSGLVIVCKNGENKKINFDKVDDNDFLDNNFFNLLKTKVKNDNDIDISITDIILLEIPNNIKLIKTNTFENFSELYRIIFFPSIKKIEEHVFTGCTNLKYIIFSIKNMIGRFNIDVSKNFFDQNKENYDFITYKKNYHTKFIKEYKVNYNLLYDYSYYINTLNNNEEFNIVDHNIPIKLDSKESKFQFFYFFFVLLTTIYFFKKYLKSIKK